ncbi:MAG: hypothetical protein FH748_16485 [Balneolaceae bacterium]|nr:hypothetical protein [Balneolaceae bacterium]
MKKIILFVILILTTHQVYGQDSVEKLQAELNNLQNIESQLSDSLDVVQSHIEQVKERIAEIEFDTIKKDKTVLKLKSGTDLYKSDGIMSDKIAQIPEGEEVIMLSITTSHFINVSYRGQKGFIPKWYFEKEEMLDELIAKQRRIEKQKSAKQGKIVDSLLTNIEKDKRWIETFVGNLRKSPNTNSDIITQLEQGEKVFVQDQKGEWLKIKYIVDQNLRRSINEKNDINSIYRDAWVHESITSKQEVAKLSPIQRRRKRFVRNNSGIKQQYKQDILNGSIRIGMSKDMVRASWGRPNDVNRTVNAHSTREQWVYGSISTRRYVYFEDGIMTSFQD